jgi:hypothetical protein
MFFEIAILPTLIPPPRSLRAIGSKKKGLLHSSSDRFVAGNEKCEGVRPRPKNKE